jgi:hypothetical protein
MKDSLLLLLGLLASVVVGGCMLATAKEEYRDDFAILKPAVGHTELVLDNINGTVSIAGVDSLQLESHRQECQWRRESS